MPILKGIVSWITIKRMNEIELFKKYPKNVQYDQLYYLLETAADTKWGKKFGFKDIKTYDEFREKLPLQEYNDIIPYVDRLRNGEQNLLWPDEIKWFAKSSGTTNDKSKFIPVSKEMLEDCHYRGGKDIIAIYLQKYPDPNIFKGKGLTLGGSHKMNNDGNENFYGDLSAILIHNLPFWAEFIKTPNKETALLDKWEEKLDLITRETSVENVTSIAGVPSWMLVLLRYILEHTGKNNITEVWPNLELFIHGGINFGPYKDQFKKLIPSDRMNYMETYNASEGFFAIQDDPQKDDMLLMLDLGIYYEFIPMDQFEESNPKAYHIGEVELRKNYAIVISTNGGLWRYIIGDTVMFTSLFPHKIRITGRTKHFINAFGEEVIIDNAEKALKVACDKTHSQISDFTAAPVFMGENTKGCHEWIIEFVKKPNNIGFFTETLDNALKSLNSDYEAKRYNDLTLKIPEVLCVKQGTFFKWLERKGKLGGQNKVPRLSNSRKYVEELKEINNMVN